MKTRFNLKHAASWLVCLFVTLMLTSSSKVTTIFVIGDSTAAEKKNPAKNVERGWGMVLQGCFDDKIVVDNHAVNGRSSKSFIDEGRWQQVLDKIKPGDYVFIQFGHNDEKPDPKRHTDAETSFADNLRRYVRETKEKGGIPVLMNAVVRRCWFVEKDQNDDDEKLRNTTFDADEVVNSDTLVDTHGAYVLVPEKVAKEMNVPFVNATKLTHDLETKLGVVESRKLHMWFRPGENRFVPKGRKDNTHYNIYGAHIVANALADAIGEQVPALKKHVRHYDFVVSKEGRGNYFTLQEAVDAVPTGVKTKGLGLGGTWKKPSNMGGKKIKFVKEFGAKIQ